MDGLKIREARKSVKMTQEQLAQVLGINRATLSKYESGIIDPPSSQLQAIATALGVSLLDLCGDHERELYKAGFDLGVYGTDHDIYGNLMMKGYTFSTQEEKVIIALSQLNDEGQQKAVERVEELTEIPRYRAETAPQSPPAPQEGTDTTPPPEGAEGPQEGE